MKKTLTLIAAATLSALSFASWADTLTVGASNTPTRKFWSRLSRFWRSRGSIWRLNPSRTTYCQTLRWRGMTLTPTISSTSLT